MPVRRVNLDPAIRSGATGEIGHRLLATRNGATAKSEKEQRMARTLDTLKDLYPDEPRDLYHAETVLAEALPDMARASHSDDLRREFSEGAERTENHIERLRQIFAQFIADPAGRRCQGMEGVLQEGRELIRNGRIGPVVDVALIVTEQNTQHYEIPGYGNASTFARILGRHDDEKQLREIMLEEKEADAAFTEVAAHSINLASAAEQPGFGMYGLVDSLDKVKGSITTRNQGTEMKAIMKTHRPRLEKRRGIMGKTWNALTLTALLLGWAGPPATAAESASPSKIKLTDSGITTAVENDLLIDQMVSSHLIDVSTIDGVVTLSGSVDDFLSKERAVAIAKSIRGVKAVVDTLQVKSAPRTDAQIRADIDRALARDPATDSYEVKSASKTESPHCRAR